MFHAVRDWWKGGSGKVALRLFLFEFVVVVAGVLTAQGLAGWVNDRAEDRAVREENARIRYEIGRARQNARVWLAATPCLEERVNQVIRNASSEGRLSPEQLNLPRFVGYTVGQVPPDIDRALRSRFDVSVVDTYGSVGSSADNVINAYRDVRQDWDRFALLDPTLGSPSQADRATVRDVGVQIRSKLRRLRTHAEDIERAAERLGIAPLTSDADVGTASPIKNCAEMWRTGRIWHE
ncbi:hypothetical protein [Sphingomonas sp.]|uniref:hypothetical protein n=1 Tax=Sphingomonas sp. TaxID=28214 RepID=UPI0025CD4014|nr:hypothetical protein [Sphingomonas sp.]